MRTEAYYFSIQGAEEESVEIICHCAIVPCSRDENAAGFG